MDAGVAQPVPAGSPAAARGRERRPSQFFFPDNDDDGFNVMEHELPSAAVGGRSWVGAVCAAVALSLACGAALTQLAPRPPRPPRLATAADEACSVYCGGKLLAAVQTARLWADSKTFVDMPMVIDPAETLSAYAVAFGDEAPSREALAEFVGRFFAAAGSDTLPHTPADWQLAPAGLAAVSPNATLREWALGMNAIWPLLGRRIIPSVQTYPQRHTLLWQPHPMIIPGGRFLESYYWDTSWIVDGLLACGMARTAEGAVLNLVHLSDTWGFVPNGGRVYYVLPGRSQPPMLSTMVRALWRASRNTSFLVQAFPALQREYVWWQGRGEYGHAVAIMEAEAAGAGGVGGDPAAPPRAPPPAAVHLLTRYVTDQHIPRPESWLEDVHTAASAGYAPDDPGAQILFSEIAAAAESGVDFSARWFADGADIATADTSHVVPVELNAIMFRVEDDLARFATVLAAQAAACMRSALRAHRAATAAEEAAEEVAIAVDGAVTWGGASVPAAARAAAPSGPASRDGVPPAEPARASTTTGAHAQPPEEQEREQDGGGGDSSGGDVCAALLARLGGGASVADTPLGALPVLFDGLASKLAADAARYAEAADDRHEAMERLMWDGQAGRWRDLRVAPEALAHTEPTGAPSPPQYNNGTSRCGVPVGRAVASRYRPRTDLQLGRNVAWAPVLSATDWAPLWAGCHCFGCGGAALAARTRRAAAALASSGLLQPGGAATTLLRTDQQWDYPNAWAPIQYFLSVGLDEAGARAGVPEARALGREIARRWLLTSLLGGLPLYEKMNALLLGRSGGGGEYVPQQGFGWSLGVAFALLERFNFSHLEPGAAPDDA